MQTLRAIPFLCYGFFEFTSPGFVRHSRSFKEGALDVDLTGRHYVCTGSSKGLGYATALELAKRGGHVHLMCRNEEGGKIAKESIEQECNGAQNVTVHICDMSEVGQVHQLATKFLDNNGRVDCLINNCGTMCKEYAETSEKVEKTLATNVLSGYVLTETFREELEKRNGRAIMVSSGGLLTENLITDDLEAKEVLEQGWDGRSVYARTKRQQVALTEYFAEKYKNNDVFYASMHPGWADTPGVRKSMKTFYEKMKDRLRTTKEGADTIVWLAASEEALEYPGGSFFFDRKPAAQHLPLAGTYYDDMQRNRFVENMRKLLKEKCKLAF